MKIFFSYLGFEMSSVLKAGLKLQEHMRTVLLSQSWSKASHSKSARGHCWANRKPQQLLAQPVQAFPTHTWVNSNHCKPAPQAT